MEVNLEDERIQRGKDYLEENFKVLLNQKVRGGRLCCGEEDL